MHAWTCCCVDVYGANGVYDVYFVLIPFAYSFTYSYYFRLGISAKSFFIEYILLTGFFPRYGGRVKTSP